jgi:hypothetical protein
VRSLLWKEWRENLKWAAVPSILLLGPMIFFGVPMLLEEKYLAYVSLVAGLSGALLGFLQVFAEARGDKRSMLMHRPLTPSQIFLSKAIAGVSLYLLAVLAPSAGAVALAATPGHVAAPFEWGMALPWLADVLTGLVYYFAGMIVAQREARWYGSQGLPLAAGVFTSVLVWNVTEFWQALAGIGLMSGLVAVAAWGSVYGGGAYSRQSRLGKFALGGTLLLGLFTLVFGAKVIIGSEFLQPVHYYPFEMGRQGQILVVQKENSLTDGRIQSIKDLAGKVPEEIAGERLDAFAFRQAVARGAQAGPRDISIGYRLPSRFLLDFRIDTTPSNEVWWYARAQRQMLGYDKLTKNLIGKFGPAGFVDVDQPVQQPFQATPAFNGVGWRSWVEYPLALPSGAFTVDFRKGIVKKVFSPPPGETVLWASQREDEREKWFHMYLGTDQSLYVLDEAGTLVCRAPLVRKLDGYSLMAVGRLDRPRRYWAWYYPQWHLPRASLVSMPEAQVVIYDQNGNEIMPRQTVPPRSGVVRDFPSSRPPVGPSAFQALSGLATSPAEVAALVGTLGLLDAHARRQEGKEAVVPLQFLSFTTQLYIPGIAYDQNGHSGLIGSFAGLMLLASAASALVCFVVPGRYAFSRARRLGWALLGFLFGPVGLLLMVTLLEWPGQVACPKCRKPRVVTREHCEHCHAEHALPEMDGTEILEPVKFVSEPVLTTSEGGHL